MAIVLNLPVVAKHTTGVRIEGLRLLVDLSFAEQDFSNTADKGYEVLVAVGHVDPDDGIAPLHAGACLIVAFRAAEKYRASVHEYLCKNLLTTHQAKVREYIDSVLSLHTDLGIEVEIVR